jgi:hypothetical protein
MFKFKLYFEFYLFHIEMYVMCQDEKLHTIITITHNNGSYLNNGEFFLENVLKKVI